MSMNPNIPLCWHCGLEMRPEKNGVAVIEMASFGPAAIWAADLWKCPECGIEVVSGLGNSPIAEHYKEAEFARELAAAQASGWSREVWVGVIEKARFGREEVPA